MLTNKPFFDKKYSKLKLLPNTSMFWLSYYFLSDSRVTSHSKKLIQFFLKDNKFLNKNLSGRSSLRSRCIFSNATRSVSAKTFWYGRHFLNSRFKAGSISGFRKC
jgi:hypothetical protein